MQIYDCVVSLCVSKLHVNHNMINNFCGYGVSRYFLDSR